jgi:hypothetical protein
MQGLDDQAEASALATELGVDLPFELGGFDDLRQRLAKSVRTARTTPLLPHRDGIRGYIYDVDTLHMTEVPIG